MMNRKSLARVVARELKSQSRAASTGAGANKVSTYADDHEESVCPRRRTDFWMRQAEQLAWFEKPTALIQNEFSLRPRWFPGGSLNACYNAVDRHVEAGHGDQTAIIHDSPVTKSVTFVSFAQLQKQVAQMAGVLAKLGVGLGDRVLIYMPMIPEAMVAMLACARVGAVHSLVFGGFAAPELATRIKHAQPKVILSANCGIEPTKIVDYKTILDSALQISDNHSVQNCVIFQRPQLTRADLKPGFDLDWMEAQIGARPVDCVPVSSIDPMYILYTSGTTGAPKGTLRPVGGHLVMLKYTMDAIFDVKPGEVYFSGSDLGWVVGHSYICYAPLLHRNTTVLFEGKPVGTPDVTAYYRLISQHKPSCVFTTPTALRVIRHEDPEGEVAGKFPMDSLRSIFVAGEHLDHETNVWTRQTFKKPVIDHYWQTESGSPILAVLGGRGENMDVPIGVSGKPVPGYDVRVINTHGNEVGPGELGNIVIKTPMPPGFTDGLYLDNENELYAEKYFRKFPGFYDTMDTGCIDEEGYISVMSRTDDVINVAGHRLSTSAIEESILRHHNVAECAVVPVPDQFKGHTPLGILVCDSDESEEVVRRQAIEQVRKDIGPVAAFNKVVCVSRLPKTRSGKIARSTIAALAQNKPFNIPATIEDPTAYDELIAKLPELGFATDPQIGNRSEFAQIPTAA